MKRIFSILAVVLVSTAMMVADEIVKLGDFYYSLGTTTATLVKDQSSDKSVYKEYITVTIPAEVKYNNYTYPVKTIGTSAFEYCSNLQSATLPATITAINTDAFYYCTKLGSVNLPEGLTTIGQRAFRYCNLTSVTIPSTVSSIGNYAFQDNPLTSVVWKPVNCSIGSGDTAPFYSTSSQITEFTFGDQVEVVPAHLCKNMSKLDTIVLPPSVKSLGNYAFMGCTSLKSINLPVTQKTLPEGFLRGCTSLEHIELPATLTTIKTDVFYYCSSLKEINLHEGITEIYTDAFRYCKLTSITIPSTVISISSNAFQNNPLTSVVWNPKACSIGEDGNAPFYSTSSQITKFTFGDEVETIPAYLCKNMSLLDTIVLPPSVKSLGNYAFMGCTSLKSINLPVTQKTLPEGFLRGCTSLERIELPATLTTIKTDAFYYCSSLKEINLHEGITEIYTDAFRYCNLTSVTIPSTVTSISNSAFQNNPLTSVVWKPKTCSIGTETYAPFYSTNSQITEFTFGDEVEVIPNYLCYKMSQLDNVVLPQGLLTIGNYAFANCSALKEVEIPASVTLVARNSFYYCTSLKSFAFPKGITTVATEVLEGCTALEEVFIPASVTTINTDAFYNCSGLKAIHNYAITPQTINENTIKNVDKQTCILYVPMDYIDLYRAKAVWCDFKNIIGVATDLQFEEQIVQLSYLKRDESLLYMETQTWEIPHAPYIEGFVFEKWEVLAGDLTDGIKLQAVYKSDQATGAPEVYTNPANSAQKLIRQGNVYILQDGKTYTVDGKHVR